MVIGLKRKGDVTITTVILIVLGLAVLVMMIIGFTKGWSFFFDWFDKGPSELQAVAEACVLYAQGSLTIDFCNYRIVDDEIVNCRDNRITSVLESKGVKHSTIACSPVSSNLATLCNTISETKRNSIKVNQFGGCVNLPESVIEKPTDLKAEKTVGSNSIKLTWKDNSGNEGGFELQRKESTEGDDKFRALTANILAGVQEYIDSGVATGKTYNYRIRARNAQGDSDWSNVVLI